MTSEQKAYLAGIIDGEGSIMLIRFHKNNHPALCISIASTSLELLEWVKSSTGVGSIKSKKNYNPTKHEDSFTYTARYNDAIFLLECIEPYLVIAEKRARANLIINEYKALTLRNGRYSEEKLKAKYEFYKKFMEI